MGRKMFKCDYCGNLLGEDETAIYVEERTFHIICYRAWVVEELNLPWSNTYYVDH